MSKTIRGEKGAGYEYWKSRLHRHGEIPSKLTKKRTHRKERKQNKKIERDLNED